MSASFPATLQEERERVGNRGRSSAGEYIHSPPPALSGGGDRIIPSHGRLFPLDPSAFVTGIQIEKVSPPTILLPEIGAINPQLGGRTEKSLCVWSFFPLVHRNLPGCSGEKVATSFSAFLRRDGSWSSSENAEMQEKCLASFERMQKSLQSAKTRVFLACS